MEKKETFSQPDFFLALLREHLAEGQSVRSVPFRGTSMLPLLRQGKDTVVLSPLPERLKKYDLPVYQYPNGKVVMHRVVAVKQSHYICLGDNTYRYETVLPEYCIALVTAIRRGDRVISVNAAGYRLYSRLWVAIHPVRLGVYQTYRLLRGVAKKILQKLGWRRSDNGPSAEKRFQSNRKDNSQ